MSRHLLVQNKRGPAKVTVEPTVIDRSAEGWRGRVRTAADGSAAVNDWPRVRDRLLGSGQPSILIFPSVGSVCFRGLTRQSAFEQTGRIGSIPPQDLFLYSVCHPSG